MKKVIFFITALILIKTNMLFAVYGQTFLVAGEGNYYGDNNTGLNATFNEPRDIIINPITGDKYIADTYNNVIREISASGIVTTIAGNPVAGYAEGTGAAASFDNPYAICLDSQDGIVYVADTFNNRIRGIYLSSSQTFLVAGLTGSGAGNGVSDGNNTFNARFYSPMGIAYDGTHNYIYVSDSYNHRIRRIDLTANTTTTIAGASYGYAEGKGTAALFNEPKGVDIDTANQMLYIADTGNNKIRGLNLATETSFYVAGSSNGWLDGNSTTAKFSTPADVSLNTVNAKLYVADQSNDDIRIIDLSAGTVGTLVGNQTAGYRESTGTAAIFNQPQGNAYNYIDNKIYVADTLNSRIRTIDPANNSRTALFAGMGNYGGDGNMAPNATFSSPYDVAINTVTGRKYIVDSDNNVIRMIDENNIISTVAGNGSPGYAEGVSTSAIFSFPEGVVVDSMRNILYISDTNNQAIRSLDLTTYQTALVAGDPGSSGYAEGTGSSAKFDNPSGIDIDIPDDILYVADTGNQIIRAIDLSTDQTSLIAGHQGSVASYAEGTGTSAYFYNPSGLLYYQDADVLCVADTYNQVLREIDLSSGTTSLIAGTPHTAGDVDTPVEGGLTSAKFNYPMGVVYDYNANILYVSDSLNEKVKAVNFTEQDVTEVAGNTSGYAEGIGTSALFNGPYGMSLDVQNQIIYIADFGNDRIRKIDVGIPTPTMIGTITASPTMTMFFSATITPTSSQTITQTQTWTITETSTYSPTDTATPTTTFTGTTTDTMTITQTETISPTNTATATNTNTLTATQTYTITETATSSSTYTYTATYTDTMTCTETATITPTLTTSPYVSSTPTYTISETSTQSPTFTGTMTFTNTPTATNSMTVTFTDTQSETFTETATFTDTQTQTPSITATLTNTTGIYVSATATPDMAVTATITPVGYIERDPDFIKDQVVIPNPSNGNFGIRFITTQYATTLNIRIYTASFRLISVQGYGSVITGTHYIPIENMGNAASGFYYYSIDGESNYGDKTLIYGVIVIIK